MKEYIRHIEAYLNYWHSSFSKLVPAEKWGDRKLAEEYLQKYWLSNEEYTLFWEPILNEVFIPSKRLPDLVFQPKFEFMVLTGGCLFQEEDFYQLQRAMHNNGEDYFVVIQHSQEFTKGEPMFRMKFPATITWGDMTSGNYISSVLLEMNYNNYFVFGEKGNWGKYTANDQYSLDILGFESELSSTFSELFTQSGGEPIERLPWLRKDAPEN